MKMVLLHHSETYWAFHRITQFHITAVNLTLQCIQGYKNRVRCSAKLDKLVTSIAEHSVSVAPDRSPLRKPPRKKRFHIAKKSVV